MSICWTILVMTIKTIRIVWQFKLQFSFSTNHGCQIEFQFFNFQINDKYTRAPINICSWNNIIFIWVTIHSDGYLVNMLIIIFAHAGSLCGSDKGNLASCEDIKHVKVLSMNICGLSKWKFDDDVLWNHFKNSDIIILPETWSAEGDNFCLSVYTFYNFPRKYHHKLSLRNSGGLGVFINHTVCNGVKLVKYTGDMVVWLRLKSSFFGFVNDFVCGKCICCARELCVFVPWCVWYTSVWHE